MSQELENSWPRAYWKTCVVSLDLPRVFRIDIYWTKVITQLVNGPIFVWICGIGQSIWDILLNYSQRIFVAQGVMSLQHGWLSSNLIGQMAFWVPGACQEVKNLKRFKIPYSNARPIRCKMSLENPLFQFHKNLTSVHRDFLSVCCQNVHTTQCKIDIAIISEDGKVIQTSMKHFLLLLLKNATKHNSIKFPAALLHVSSDKFCNCLKDLNAIMLNFLFVGEQADFMLDLVKEEHW